MVFPIESVQNVHRALLQFGADAEVVAPPELRARLAETAAALVALYGDQSSPTSSPQPDRPYMPWRRTHDVAATVDARNGSGLG